MRNVVFSLALLSMLAPTAAVQAGDGHGHGKGGHLSNKTCCPACNYVCELSVTKDKVTKTCYEVDCKPICIPPVTFPWEGRTKGHGKGKGCGKDCYSNGCAKVKVVRVLVKEEYECSRCKCVWTPVAIKGKDAGKYDGKDDGQSNVPAPPAVSARLNQRPHGQPSVVAQVDQATLEQPAPPANRSYFEILTGFFK